MKLNYLKIKNYRNIQTLETHFNSQVICLTGSNGAGKTNLLDAIYYLSNTRSYINHIDAQNINHQNNDFYLETSFQQNGNSDIISCYYSEQTGKIFKINDKKYPRLADHYGRFPSVIITPTDISLIIDGSEVRRNFVDAIISIYNADYLHKLNEYKRIILQRNILLKKMSDTNKYDSSILEIYDYKLMTHNPFIFEQRRIFLQNFEPIFQEIYNFVANNNEKVSIVYNSQLFDNDIAELLNSSFAKDMALQHTSVGIHKDDFVFAINSKTLKKTASQGQQKTFLLALKLAKALLINKLTTKKPILLLDDIFDKLDTNRVENIVRILNQLSLGQIFITHTDANFLHNILDKTNFSYTYLKIQNGSVAYE